MSMDVSALQIFILKSFFSVLSRNRSLDARLKKISLYVKGRCVDDRH